MMEEVNDDTNGESSFEFVSGKIEDVSKDESTPAPSTAPFYVSAPSQLDSSKPFPVSPPSLAPTFPVKTESNVTFYDIDPKDSRSFMLPPLTSPAASTQVLPSGTSAPSSQYPATQQSFSPVVSPQSQSYQSPQGPPLSYQVSPAVSQNYQASQAPAQSYPAPQTSAQNYQAAQAPPTYYSPQPDQVLSLPLDSSAETISLQQQQQSSEGGVWGWLKGKDFLNKVAEKAKNSVDSVITTLDPGMKEIINSGGDINVIVASGNEDKISAVREAFQLVFGKATVQGMAVQSSSIAPQPVGVSAGLKAAEERINNLKQMGFAQERQILVAIENFLAELTPDNWFDMGCFLLQDQTSGITLQVYTEAIPVSSQYIAIAKDQTPSNYPLGWSGYAVTIGQIMGPALGVHHSLWHQALTGVSRREILLVAAKTIAGLYRSQVGR